MEPDRPSAPLFSMIQINDAHLREGADAENGRQKLEAVLQALDSGEIPRPELVLLAGDLVHLPTEENFAPVAGFIAALKGATVLPVPGNHDIHVDPDPQDSATYEKFFGPGRLNYHFLHKGVLFVLLNNADGDARNTEALHLRNDWLERTLAAHAETPKIFVCHVPLVPMREGKVLAASFDFPTWTALDPEARLLRLVEEYRETTLAVLSAHLHLSAHREQNGVHFIVPSGTISWPNDIGCYTFYPDRVEVAMKSLEGLAAPGSMDAYPFRNGIHDRHGAESIFTDAGHPTFAEYIKGTAEERSFTILLNGKKRLRP